MGPSQYRSSFAVAVVASVGSSLAACRFSHGVSQLDDDAAVVDGARADASTTTDAPTPTLPPDAPITPPTDTDNDSVIDASDNCPTVANTNQRNHDGDGKGDACDRCPHLASATDPDGDGDGVGDACDPRDGTAGDSIVLFEGFYDATAITGWTIVGNGSWSVANGVLTQSSAMPSMTTAGIVPPVNVPRAYVMSSATVIALGNGNGNFASHVSIAAGVTNNQSYWCSIVDDNNNDKVYASVVRPMMPPSYPNTAWSGTFTASSQLQLELSLLGSANTCVVRQGVTTATIAGNLGPPGGAPELATRTAAASFDYLFVASIGN